MPRLAPHQLTEKKLKRLKEGMHSDGGNLYLSIRGNSKAWVFRFKSPVTGRIRMLGLGSLPDITLKIARELACRNREMLRNELDPLAIKQSRKSFENIVRNRREKCSCQWKDKNTEGEIESFFVNYLYLLLEKHSVQMSGLEPFSGITLGAARKLVSQNQANLRKDSNSLIAKSNDYSFENIAKDFIEERSKQWKGKKTKKETEGLFINYLYPFFKERPIQSITSDDVFNLLKSIWYDKTITGVKLQGLLDRLFKYAIARGWFIGDNPAKWNGLLENLLPKSTLIKKVNHRKAYDWKKISKLYKRLKSVNDIPNLATCLICLTACRSAEVREMRVDEIDFHNKIWTLPASRNKTDHERRVPLSDEALLIIKRAMEINNNEATYIFQHKNKPIYDKAVLTAVKEAAQDPEMTLHGFRSSFRDWGSEATNIQSELLEMALGHAIKSKVESAYRRGDLLDKRRYLMNKWAAFCSK